MNKDQLDVIKNRQGFIAALDQSGGSTPKALLNYGIDDSMYSNETEMFNLIHQMRTRIITSDAFTSQHILGAILFEATMYEAIDGLFTADYLWDRKKIVPFLKIDKGLEERAHGVALMKDMPHLHESLQSAQDQNIFGTKMRSVIYEHIDKGIIDLVNQQFEIGKIILDHDLVPIIEPEVDIHASNKGAIEVTLKEEILKHLDGLAENQYVMLKLTPPDENDFYLDLVNHPKVLRVVFLSGGYSQKRANDLLALNHGAIASFSRALTQDLRYDQSDLTFNITLDEAIKAIYNSSIS